MPNGISRGRLACLNGNRVADLVAHAALEVSSFGHLKDRPNADEALHMLQRVASLVKPVMRKRSWVLPVLAEFFPDSPNLLDINHGQKICLRLRPAHAPDRLLDEEDVVQTMLHELTHNVHGPHDEKFYKFLSELQEEYDALQRSGYAGEGFFSKGRRLGTDVSHNLPPHIARLKALEAAEKRRQTARVLGTGGRLGGRINTKGLSPRELAAQAAERRLRDEKACGSGVLAEQEANKAAEQSIQTLVIDLTSDSEDDVDRQSPVAGPSSVTATSGGNRATKSTREPALPRKMNELIKSEWTCPLCTLINLPEAFQCEACLTGRPPDTEAGWICSVCGETGMPHEMWSCRFCGTVKVSS